MLRACSAAAKLIPEMKASYSAWLLVAWNENLIACMTWKPSGLMSTTPAPLRSLVDDPSTKIFYWVLAMSVASSTGLGSDFSSALEKEHSTTKSANAWALIAFLGKYEMEN